MLNIITEAFRGERRSGLIKSNDGRLELLIEINAEVERLVPQYADKDMRFYYVGMEEVCEKRKCSTACSLLE